MAITSIRVDRHPGEWLPSLIGRIAHFCGVSPLALCKNIGVDTAGRNLQYAGTRVSDHTAERIAGALNWEPQDIHAMTMSDYSENALRLSSDGHIAKTHLWTRGAGTRYCPACLRQHPGMFLKEWKLTFTFVCLRHRIILNDVCTLCETPTTEMRMGAPRRVDPTRCHAPVPVDEERRAPCNAEWSKSWTDDPLPQDSPILAAQQDINTRIASGQALPLLTNLRANAIALLGADAIDLISELSQTPRSDLLGLFEPGHRLGTTAPASAFAMSALTAASWRLLTDNEPSVRRSIRQVTFDRPVGHVPRSGGFGPGSAAFLLSSWPESAPPMQGRILRALDSDLPTLQRLTWGSTTDAATDSSWMQRRKQQRLSGYTFELAPGQFGPRDQSIPALLWPEWTVPNDVGTPTSATALQRGFAQAVLIANTRTMSDKRIAGIQDVFRPTMLGSPTETTAILSSLTELALIIDAEPGPIRYDRRRHLTWPRLLTQQQWRLLAEQLDLNVGTRPRRLRFRRYMFTRLTGAGLKDLPGVLRIRHPREVAEYTVFMMTLTTRVVAAVDDYLKAFLEHSGIHEPVTWSPPRTTSGPLTARELDDIDIAHLHSQLAGGPRSLSSLSYELGRHERHVRWAIDRYPIEDGPAPNPLDWTCTF
ncbi:hypothetical protein AX769_04055 [Frondihabitans sp. PAMC 28766]|uniref:TniQ family protein n=1 Tax=Frondihabitans sp. PAMC 28766 TaxID=1795630 RepID=UPI00078C61D9|nr:TniQ family protein [Frondihabitans sp. PAMC 28766]AMM19466.1 hypothetical protein AX769_04055 [Frondihabitans sp. PAMC 28766]